MSTAAVKTSTTGSPASAKPTQARGSRAEQDLRKQIIEYCLAMNASGLNQGTSGNISVRFNDAMLITPSGIPYDEMLPKQIAKMPLHDTTDAWDGPCKPSSEWHFHRAILQSDNAYGAVIHTHSTFATVLAMAGRSIPACHYMVAAFGGNSVRCAKYATYGTAELSQHVLSAMRDRSACLMANHGMVVAGNDLHQAMWAATELETLARQYYHASMAGNVRRLSKQQIDIVLEKFKSYGLQAQQS